MTNAFIRGSSELNKPQDGLAGNSDIGTGATLIAAWPKNSREEIRVHLDRFKDRNTVDVRTWWRDSEDELKPGRSGITLAVRHLPNLANALAKALEEAERRGLMSEEEGT